MSMLGGEEMELGKQIKKHRQEVQLSQEELAERVYVSRQTISNWVPLFMLLGVWALIPWCIIWGISMYFAFMLEKIKKGNDVQTYKEIVAFSDGQLLDDIQKQREIGKRPYQKILLVIGSGLITFAVCILIGFLMHVFLN